MTIDDLIKKYPTIFDETCPDVSINAGWVPLVDELCAELLREGVKVKASQVKEKFGRLRFYGEFKDDPSDSDWDLFYKILSKYEDKSLVICFECGRPGYMRTGGWFIVLCNDHAEERKPTFMLEFPEGHHCNDGWGKCSVCKENVCTSCAAACYQCVDAYKHWNCLKKHVEETKHEGLCNDLGYLITLVDKRPTPSFRGLHGF